MIWARRRLLTFAGNQHHMLRQIMQSPWWLLKVRQYMKHRNKESALLYKLFYIVSVDCFSKVCGWTTKHNELMKNYQSIWCPERIKMINGNLKTIKLWVIIALHRLSIKSSKSLENKGFIAMCSPYPFIWFHTSLLFPWLLIRANSRAKKSDNKI